MFPAIALLASAAIGAGTSIYNAYQQRKTNQTVMDREDNSVYRRVQDLLRSGLSPVLASGSSASTSQLNSPSVDSTALQNLPLNILAMRQGYAGIAQTKAQTALTNQQATSEQYKQNLLTGQAEEIGERIKNMQSERAGIDLRNSWYNADMASTMALRDGQLKHMAQDTLRIGQQTELLKAQTAYQQTAMDKLLTDIDNAKILRDMNMIDRDWRTQMHQADIFSKYGNVKLTGLISGGIGSIGASLDSLFGTQLNRNNWYYPKN